MEGLVAPLVIVIVILVIFFQFVPFGLWVSAVASGVRVGFISLIGMRLRRVNPSRVINPTIKGTKAQVAKVTRLIRKSGVANTVKIKRAK